MCRMVVVLVVAVDVMSGGGLAEGEGRADERVGKVVRKITMMTRKRIMEGR